MLNPADKFPAVNGGAGGGKNYSRKRSEFLRSSCPGKLEYLDFESHATISVIMPKIAASIVFPVSSPPRRNAVVDLDEKGKILSVSQGRTGFSEMAGVAYYSGILIPGLTDVMCGREKSNHWLLSRGVRVAGRTDLPDDDGTDYENDMEPLHENSNDSLYPAVKETGMVTWKGRYGGMVGNRIFNGMDHFLKYFKAGEVEGVFYMSSDGNEKPVLASGGRMEMMELMIELQEGPGRFNLQVLLEMATLNGAVALECDNMTGSFSTGKQPGVNIIEGADLSGMKLLPGSRLRRLL